jgi:HK97 gp10 family phage protein
MRWYGASVKAKMDGMVNERLDRAARETRDYIRKQISTPNIEERGDRGRNRKGQFTKAKRGTNPSKPGEYPHKLTGHLRRNVEMEHDREKMIARVGTNVEYGRYLELGTRKMKRRPWLSRALVEMRQRIKQILRGR